MYRVWIYQAKGLDPETTELTPLSGDVERALVAVVPLESLARTMIYLDPRHAEVEALDGAPEVCDACHMDLAVEAGMCAECLSYSSQREIVA